MKRLALLVALSVSAMTAAAQEKKLVPVTVDNFVRAESDRAFGGVVKDSGFGKFHHARDVTALDKQIVPRQNRDTLYSTAVFDLDAGPVTVTLPDAGQRFMTLMSINEDHYVVEVVYDAKPHMYTREQVGTRYMLVAGRTLVDPADPKDVQAVHKLQDAITVEQPGGPGKFEVPNWEPREPEEGARSASGAQRNAARFKRGRGPAR